MATHNLKKSLKEFAVIFILAAMISCNAHDKSETKESSGVTSEVEMIPDTVVQFLITSAVIDFRDHQPPTPIDFRNVKVGYLKSTESKKIFVLCGEFLSKEDNYWIAFTTIKTSGYEQYIGKTQYCHDAILVLTDERLSLELKSKLTEEIGFVK
jgi:hypothetical protein